MPCQHPFVKTIARSLRRFCGVRPGDRMLAAVSGGADSVALLRALAILAPTNKWRLHLTVAHVQHHLRDQAEQDAQFVAELADQLGLDGLRADVDPAAYEQGNVEAVARTARYQALTTMAQQVDARWIALAHHGDDQLETLLLRLMRGAAARGLAGMRWRRRVQPGCSVRLVRPMLALDRAAVLAFLADLEQPWREDHTNADVSRARARLRRDVAPVLRDLAPSAARKTIQLTDHLRQLVQVFDAAVDHYAVSAVTVSKNGEVAINRKQIQAIYPTMVHELLRRVLQSAGVSADKLSNRALSPIVRAVQDGRGGQRRFALSNGVSVLVTRETARIDQLRQSR